MLNFSHRYIYWRDGITNGNGMSQATVHLLVGYCPNTIGSYKAMADELRKTFPQATDDEIHGSKIYKSFYADGHTIIIWTGLIPRKQYPGWDDSRTLPTEYEF